MSEYRAKVEEWKRTVAQMEADLTKKKQLWELKKADARASLREFNVDEPKMGEVPPAISWPNFRSRETTSKSRRWM